MFRNFQFEGAKGTLTGYEWPVETPVKVMCIIHGIGEHAGRYDRMAGVLNEAGIAVLAMDLPGHGKSYGKRGQTAPRRDVFTCIDRLLEKAETEWPGVPVVLYGHSMGGNLCLDYRSRGAKNALPEKYIVSAPWLKLVLQFPTPVYALLHGAAKLMPNFQMSSGCKAEALGNIEITRPYDTDPLVHTKITLQTAIECFDIAAELCAGTLENNHGADGKPFLLMHGDADKSCSVEGSRMVAAQYQGDPQFTYREWPGYYHEIHNGGPEADGMEVIKTIRDFVLA